MWDTDKKFCSIIFDIIEAKGIKDIVCSSGSRNVPLLLAAAARKQLTKHFAIDERVAAFMALGMAMVSKKPVVLLCTSGTALLDYAPAVAEAYYQGIPLLIISADRPIQWIDQDDSQTLRQDKALDNFVKKSYSIPALGEENLEMQWYVNRCINDGIDTATTGKNGPVHFNIHLSEPLSGKTKKAEVSERIITTIQGDTIANKEIIKSLSRNLADSRVLLVAGFNLPDSALQKALATFMNFPNVAVMAETISNFHLSDESYMIDSVLSAFDPQTLKKAAPDIVISLGGALVSRKLKEYLRKNAGNIKHWSLGYSHTTSDPFMSLSLRIESDPVRFLRSINHELRKLPIKSKDYKETWKILKKEASSVKESFIQKSDWSELKAFDFILKNIPSASNLFLSNGTPVRYAQIIRYRMPHASYCNRGVSGIDGSTSTAIGGAISYKGQTILISGDLSFAYDIGALGLNNIPENFKIIIIDNQGGGIFRFIPSTSSLEEREEYLCQPPHTPYQNLAEGYGWKYFEVDSEKSLKELFPDFIQSGNKSMMRIICPGEESASILKNYMNVVLK